MSYLKFIDHAANTGNPNWAGLTARPDALYSRADDIRSDFARDYTRILHSLAYRRLKHKTQVFFNVGNDHICTRMEHVGHVASVSETIAKTLGLNTELTRAIAIGHDLGHAPFGHDGEHIISDLSKAHLGKTFWHEQNSLRFVDDLELLEDPYRKLRNLNLTYAVRDGIISHCGEVDDNGLRPREQLFPLEQFTKPGLFSPATWEGCVVKIVDKIAYIGRDIEDAINLGFLDHAQQEYLAEMARANDANALNTTVIMHNMMIDICDTSTPESGICLSQKYFGQMKAIKDFNYANIYHHKRLEPFKRYAKLVIHEIFQCLLGHFAGNDTWRTLGESREIYPELIHSFEGWLAKYCHVSAIPEGSLRAEANRCANKKVYGGLESEEIYSQAILDFISGMTDSYAIKVFHELITY